MVLWMSEGALARNYKSLVPFEPRTSAVTPIARQPVPAAATARDNNPAPAGPSSLVPTTARGKVPAGRPTAPHRLPATPRPWWPRSKPTTAHRSGPSTRTIWPAPASWQRSRDGRQSRVRKARLHGTGRPKPYCTPDGREGGGATIARNGLRDPIKPMLPFAEIPSSICWRAPSLSRRPTRNRLTLRTSSPSHCVPRSRLRVGCA